MGKSSPLGTSGEYYMFCHLQVYPLNDPFFFSFRAPEALFQPSFVGLESAGIHDTTYVGPQGLASILT